MPSAARWPSWPGLRRSQPAKEVAAAAATEAESIARCSPSPSPTIRARPRSTRANAKAPPRFEVKPPKGAPNVIVFLIDDIGFGHPSTFGGGIPMPTLDRLASQGLKYNRFHTTALCSPTRVALLTGRNHHTNNAGAIMEVATAFPGNTGARPQSVTPLAEILRQNGYSTSAFGKYHETAPWEVSVSGPFDRWPTHSGFDKFYGFIGGETNQWAPLVFDGTVKVEVPRDPNYHFTTDMTNQAIGWIRAQQSLTPDKPFFTYFATGATHAPHHVPKEWIAKFKGKFDGGWDKYREETFARQKQLGIVPQNAKLAPKPADIKDWDKLTPDEKRLFARQMEVFAAFAAHTDYEIGRVVKAIEDMGELDNTLILYLVGDNGASAEGGMIGMFNEMTYFNGVPETVPDMLKNIDKWGGPETFPHMAAGWAVAGNTPFMWTKQVAANFGGTRNPLVVSWPDRIKAKGEIRSQFHHVVDIAPTVLEAAGLPEPKTVNGIAADADGRRQHGVHVRRRQGRRPAQDAVLRDLRQPRHLPRRMGGRDRPQGAVGSRSRGARSPRTCGSSTTWTRTSARPTTSRPAIPAKLKELQALFMKEAEKYRVLPIDDRVARAVRPRHGGPSGPDGRPQDRSRSTRA